MFCFPWRAASGYEAPDSVAGTTGSRTKRKQMAHRARIIDSHELMAQDQLHAVTVTRRALGKLAAGALSAVGVGGGARAQSAATTPEPEGPDHLPRRRIKVLDTEISYVDTGEGDPVVFLHGNPTWSYQWRNIVPYLSDRRRCLAPDFVGMGWSGNSPSKAYRFVDQARYIDAWLEALQLIKNVTLVGHDWGGPISFYRARRFPKQIKAIAYYETIVLPRRWEDYPGDRGKRFQAMRSPEGERLVLDENFFVEVVLPAGTLRKLSDAEMEAYRAPYWDRERRLPTLVWPRELPIEGEPADVVAIVEQNAQWLTTSTSLPKLFINGDPGTSISGRLREFCRTLPNQREVTVKGLHHLQEDAPNEMGAAIRDFVLGLG
jgi:haloalkane dehalogenase